MKIRIDTDDLSNIKVGNKLLNESNKKDEVISILKQIIRDNSVLDEYETDSMWMSYRYCIGRHTIASHMRAFDIAKNCYGRLSKERSIFNAFDINREIESHMGFSYPCFRFPITSLNKIYTTAVDIICEFIEDNNIKSKEDFIKYKEINVELDNTNDKGYTLYVLTWDEWLNEKFEKLCNKYNLVNKDVYTDKDELKTLNEDFSYFYKELDYKPKSENFYMLDLEDLFVWNDLCHLFDIEHHHKSILIDGTVCEWYWTWTEKHNDEGYKIFGYKKIRRPIKNNFNFMSYIPDESIKENLY